MKHMEIGSMMMGFLGETCVIRQALCGAVRGDVTSLWADSDCPACMTIWQRFGKPSHEQEEFCEHCFGKPSIN